MTTSLGSANAEAMPANRRAIIGSLAAAGALSLPALPALAATSEPGPIEAMWPELLRLDAVLDEACTRTMDAEELYEEPERPGWHPFREAGGYLTVMTGPNRGVAVVDVGDQNIAYLKGLIAKEHEPDNDPDISYQYAERARDARKTLSKIEAWHAEVKRRKDAAGLTVAEIDEQKAVTARHAYLERVFAVEATTIRDLALQASIFAMEWHQAPAELVLARLVELAGVAPYGVA